MRMVDRVHGDAAVMRLASEPAVTTGLADRNVHVVRVGDCADSAGAAAVNQALFARVQTNDDVVMVAADQLGIGAGGPASWPPLPIFNSTLWMMVPIGMLPSGITLPGLTST